LRQAYKQYLAFSSFERILTHGKLPQYELPVEILRWLERVF